MAINKSEAASSIGLDWVSHCEGIIDLEIRAQYPKNEKVVVYLAKLSFPTQQELDELVSSYQGAGWDVKVSNPIIPLTGSIKLS